MRLPEGERYDAFLNTLNPFWQNISHLQAGTVNYAATIACLKEHRQFYDAVITYDNLKAKPEAALSLLFELLDVGQEHLESALEPTKKDSQRAVFKEGINKVARQSLSSAQAMEMDCMLASLALNLRVDMSKEEFDRYVGASPCC